MSHKFNARLSRDDFEILDYKLRIGGQNEDFWRKSYFRIGYEGQVDHELFITEFKNDSFVYEFNKCNL